MKLQELINNLNSRNIVFNLIIVIVILCIWNCYLLYKPKNYIIENFSSDNIESVNKLEVKGGLITLGEKNKTQFNIKTWQDDRGLFEIYRVSPTGQVKWGHGLKILTGESGNVKDEYKTITQNINILENLRIRGSNNIEEFNNIKNFNTLINDSNLVPVGTIIAFKPDANNIIPDGWVVCDGNNNTPDLRNKFILGTGNLNEVGDTSGNETHSHGAGSYFTTMEFDGGKFMKRGGKQYFDPNYCYRQYQYDWVKPEHRTERTNYGIEIGGNSQDVSNMPPYYKLIYIMRKQYI